MVFNYIVEAVGFSVFISSRDSMFFLPFMDVWLANEPAIQQVIPSANQSSNPLDEEEMLFDEIIQVKPFFLEGSVEDFDPVQRAISLSKELPKRLCGMYRSFNEVSSKKVTLNFTKIKPKGQILELGGKMFFDKKETTFTGILNAKSNQLELIPLTNLSQIGLAPGGSFIGLQGTKLFTWKSSSLNDSGGRLELKNECIEDISKASFISPVWRLN